jgi:hypothetical protein
MYKFWEFLDFLITFILGILFGISCIAIFFFVIKIVLSFC